MANINEVYDALKAEFSSPSRNLEKCGQYLKQLKIALTENRLLLPDGPLQNSQDILIARHVLEIGAFWSIHVKDIESFVRYYSQLATYYTDYADILPPSSQMYPLQGLNLLRLLAQNRIAAFHTELERLDNVQDLVHNNVYIRHPVQLEQWLMEGSYSKVWNARSQVPAEEYGIFVDILMGTIRNEIASCQEKAYSSLPVGDAASLLFFNTEADVLNFAVKRGWTVIPTTKTIQFSKKDGDKVEIPANTIIKKSLYYARELEQIV